MSDHQRDSSEKSNPRNTSKQKDFKFSINCSIALLDKDYSRLVHLAKVVHEKEEQEMMKKKNGGSSISVVPEPSKAVSLKKNSMSSVNVSSNKPLLKS